MPETQPKDFWQQTGETIMAGASATLPIALTLAPLLLGPPTLWLVAHPVDAKKLFDGFVESLKRGLGLK